MFMTISDLEDGTVSQGKRTIVPENTTLIIHVGLGTTIHMRANRGRGMEVRIITIEGGIDMMDGMGDGRSMLKGGNLKREGTKGTGMRFEGVSERLKVSHVGQVGSHRKCRSGNRVRIRVREEVKVAWRFHGKGRIWAGATEP